MPNYPIDVRGKKSVLVNPYFQFAKIQSATSGHNWLWADPLMHSPTWPPLNLIIFSCY